MKHPIHKSPRRHGLRSAHRRSGLSPCFRAGVRTGGVLFALAVARFFWNITVPFFCSFCSDSDDAHTMFFRRCRELFENLVKQTDDLVEEVQMLGTGPKSVQYPLSSRMPHFSACSTCNEESPLPTTNSLFGENAQEKQYPNVSQKPH